MRSRLLLNWNSFLDVLCKSYQTVIQMNKDFFFSAIISTAADLRGCKEVLRSGSATSSQGMVEAERK